jgi:hypothetical protein
MSTTDLTDIIGKHDFPFEVRQQLLTDLVTREDAALHLLVHAAAQFGLYPQIVLEVLAQSGLGSPLTPQRRAEIRDDYDTLIEKLREQG